MLNANKALKKGPMGALGLLKGIKPGDLAPQPPSIKNFLTGEVMGHSSDRLSARFGVSRADQDEYTVLSHTTAANSSYLTDGASACMVMSEEKALELGYTPKAYIRDWTYVASDPFEELLLGPTYATHQILKRTNLKLSDIGVIEFHEAFAGQVLSNMEAMASDEFASSSLDGNKVGRMNMDVVNTMGGSLSIGHPFGATGCRLITTASNRLQREEKQFALITACADGGLATAC